MLNFYSYWNGGLLFLINIFEFFVIGVLLFLINIFEFFVVGVLLFLIKYEERKVWTRCCTGQP